MRGSSIFGTVVLTKYVVYIKVDNNTLAEDNSPKKNITASRTWNASSRSSCRSRHILSEAGGRSRICWDFTKTRSRNRDTFPEPG